MSEAKELFKDLTQSYFVGAWVTFSRQSRAAKPDIPLVTITPGNVHRPLAPIYKTVDGESLGYYPSRIQMTVDLFTKGKPVIDDDTGQTVAYENTAEDDMLAFADFLNSPHTVDWSNGHDVTLLIEGDVQDLTGLVNDTSYEFRSRLVVMLYFTQMAVGYAGVASEDSVQPATIILPGEPGMEEPGPEAPGTEDPGQDETLTPGTTKPQTGGFVVKLKYEQTSSGGGSEELAQETTGYFTEVEIKEDKV